jgi:hypothetical protein
LSAFSALHASADFLHMSAIALIIG